MTAATPFSKTSIEISETIGVLPELMMVATAKDARLPFEQLLLTRQILVERITLTMLDVSSVTAELDCENERGDQLRDQLQQLEEQRTRGLTVASLVLGAATAIISGGITLSSPDAVSASVVNIVGGSAQAGTGFAALSYTPKGMLRQERNLLTDIWEGKSESEVYPASVWRFLNHIREGNSEMPLRQTLIEQWKAAQRLGVPDAEAERRRSELIFGTGGEYTVADLRARRAILDQLKATVTLLYQDLEQLLREVSRYSGSD
jgi:hypothetical protein